MAPWILAHGNGLDDLVVLASGMALALAVRLLVTHRRTPDDPQRSPPMSEQPPDPSTDDDLSDPAASHASDLDPRIDSDEDQPEQTLGAEEAGP
jgi:hypothetical protein